MAFAAFNPQSAISTAPTSPQSPTTFLQNPSTSVPTYRAFYGSEEARYIANTNNLLAQYERQVNAILMFFNKAPAHAVTPSNPNSVASGSFLAVLCTSGTPSHAAGIKAFVVTVAVRAQTALFYHEAVSNAPQVQVTAIANLVESMLDHLEARIVALRMTVTSLFGPCTPRSFVESDFNGERSAYLLRSTQQGTALLAAPATEKGVQATEACLATTSATPEGLPSWSRVEALSLENQTSFAEEASGFQSSGDTKAWLEVVQGTGLWKPSTSSSSSSSAAESLSPGTSRRSSVSSVDSVVFTTESRYTLAPSSSSSKFDDSKEHVYGKYTPCR